MNESSNFVFRPTRVGIRKVLGDLEAKIMELIWQMPEAQPVCVRDVYEALRSRRRIAYTTVMTTMSRLATKGLLSVDKTDQTHMYRPRLDKNQFTQDFVGRLLDHLLLDFSGATLAHLVSQADPTDKEKIDQILRQIEGRRRQPKST